MSHEPILPGAWLGLLGGGQLALDHQVQHADGTVGHKAVLHQNVQHARREHAPHGTAFHDQSCFHTGPLLLPGGWFVAKQPHPVGRGSTESPG